MGLLLDEFELDYRKREIRRYESMLDDGKQNIEVPIQAVVKMLAENLSYRSRIDSLMESILRHNFTIPQQIVPVAVCRECDSPLDGFYQKHTSTGFSMVCSKCATP